MLRALIILFSAALLTACGVAADGGEVQVYRSTGAVQCEANSGRTVEQAQAQLEDIGVTVSSAACGSQDIMVMTVCGAGTTDIHLLTIARVDLPQAEALGYRAVAELGSKKAPGFQTATCQ